MKFYFVTYIISDSISETHRFTHYHSVLDFIDNLLAQYFIESISIEYRELGSEPINKIFKY